MAKIFSLFFTIAMFSLSACNTVPSGNMPLNTMLSMQKTPAELKKNAEENFESKKYGRAAKLYFSALKQDETDNEARLGLAESYFKLGSVREAYSHFQVLLSVPEYEFFALQGTGLVELMKGEFEAAENSLNSAVAVDESLWRSWNGLAQIHDHKNNWNKAAIAYENALKETNSKEVIYNNMGVSYMAQEDFKKAAKAFNHALRYKPDLKIADTNYKLALAMMDRYDEATIEHDVYDEAKALNNAGYAAMLQKNYGEAERLFLKSMEVNPSFYKAPYRNLQVLYHLKKKL